MKSKTWTSRAAAASTLGLALLLAACGAPGEPELTAEEQERADVREILAQLEPNQAMELDFADDVHHRFFMSQLRRAGESEEKSPRLFEVLAQHREEALNRRPRPAAAAAPAMAQTAADSTVAMPINAITSLASPAPTVDSSAISSVPGGTLSTAIILTLFDADHNAIGTNKNKQFNQGESVPVAANGNLPADHKKVSSAATVSIIDKKGNPLPPVVVHLSSEEFPDTITNNDPAQKIARSSPMIKVCLGRSQFKSDCDYDEPATGTPGHPNVIFPIKGSATFASNVTAPSPPSNPTNASAQIFVLKPTGGGCELPIKGNFFEHTTTSGKTFSWDLEPANFGEVCTGNGEMVTYTSVVLVTVGGNQVPITVTNAPGAKEGPGTVVIPPMEIVFGCLAAGTEVRMADGSLKAIDDMVVREQVLSDNEGTVLTVEDTFWGTEEIPLIRIEDERGHSLLLTEGHPVVTPEGVKLAKVLRVGDEVVVEDGVAQLVAVGPEPFDGKVYNLNVGLEPEEDVGDDDTTFFANGFLVGDNRMQRTFGLAHQTKKENVLENLPEEWHEDYHNWLKEKGETPPTG